MPGCTIDLRTAYARLPQPARPMPVPLWRSLKRSSAGKVERWLRYTRARQIGDAWRNAQCTSSRERAMNKHYPHLADKLPAPSQKSGNIRSLIFWWWAWEDSNLQPNEFQCAVVWMRDHCKVVAIPTARPV